MILIQQIFYILSLVVDSIFTIKIYKLSNKSKVTHKFILLCITIQILPILSYIFFPMIEDLLLLLEPLFFYLYFIHYLKLEKYLSLFLSLFLVNTVSSSTTFLQVFISSLTGDGFFNEYLGIMAFIISFIAMGCMIYIIKIFNFELSYFKNQVFYILIKNIIIVYLTIYIFLRLSDYISFIPHFNSSASIISTITFLAFIFSLGFLKSFRERLEKEEEIERKIKEQELFQKYTDEIVELYNEIRGFRHDYAGMLVSFKSSIDSGDMENVQNIYDKVLLEANLSLRSDKYTSFDLNNVGIPAFRSVLTEAMLRAKEADLDVTFEIREYIAEVSNSLSLLDFVRMISILLNNAVEGAAESYEKKLHISLVKVESSTIFVVQNSRKKGYLDCHQIFERGFSTKGTNRGLGLDNIKEIIEEYDEITLETEITEDTFTQVLTFH